MLTDLLLAIAHHLLMFALLTLLVMELMLIRPDIGGGRLRYVARIDIAYGAVAGTILLVGIGRVLFGLKGWEYYVGNHYFWAKMLAFIVVGLLSVPPTLRIAAWRRRMAADADFRPPADEVAATRRFMHWEAMVFALIPIFAAIMARYGS